MQILDAKNLYKSFGSQKILEGVRLTVQTGERVGLVGNNGSGKSTLARILAGIDQPDTGELALRRDVEVGYLPQTPTLAPELSAREHVLAGLGEWSAAMDRHTRASAALAAGDVQELEPLLRDQASAAADVERLGGWDLSHQAETVLGFLGLTDLDRPLGTMSGGEQRRVDLGRILVACPALAILDEPTNHLDLSTVEWLEAYLVRDYPGALLLITHDRYVLDSVVQRTLELDQGKLFSYAGGYQEYLTEKAERMKLAARTEANRQGFLRRELEWLRRQPKARTGKQKARIQRAHTALEADVPLRQQSVKLRAETRRSGKAILELRDLVLKVADRTLIDGLDLVMTRRQRLGVIGPNGCGKTSLLRTIKGELKPEEGTVSRGKNTRVSYLSQARDSLDTRSTILRNVAGDGMHVHMGDQQIDVHSYLARFMFSPDQLRQPVSSLSGGERTRVALAQLLLHTANLILMDEPTNDLDVSTLGALETMLLDYPGSIVVVTHDRWFLDRIATSILSFEGDGQVDQYEGNYSTYRALRQRRQADERPRPRKAQPRRRAREPRGLTYGERLELSSLEETIEAADERVTSLEARLADPELYQRRGQEVPGLQAELAEARAAAAALMSRWEELETKNEGAT